MDNSKKITINISNFIYENPESVAMLLQDYGYKIETENKSLSEVLKQINAGVFTFLYDGNINFANDLALLIQNGGYVNFVAEVVGFVASLGSTLITAFTGQDIAKKQRELQETIASANRASEEKLANSKLATLSETERVKMIADSLTQHSISLQKQSTMELNNTWIYVVGIGGILAVIYGIILIRIKTKQNG
jgi:hypothetical protein